MKRKIQPLTIESGQQVSGSVDLSNFPDSALAIEMPAAFTGTQLTFEASSGGSAWSAVQEVGGTAAYSVTVGPSKWIPLDPRVLAAVDHLRVVSDSIEPAARVVNVIIREVA